MKMEKKGNAGKWKRDIWTLLAFVSGLGVHFAVVVGVGIYLGRWLDAACGTHPWGAIGGILAGTAAAIWTILKKLLGKP